MPAGEITLECLQKLTQALLKCGAPIEEINVVRKHVSAIQGGRLAQVAARQGARVIALIISDVVGDQPCDIASGPCAPDPSTYDDAMAILEKYALQTDPQLMQVISHIRQGQQGLQEETLKPQDILCQRIENHVFATAQKGLEAASQYCQAQGYEVHLLGDRISGESREFARAQAQLIKNALQTSNTKRIAWISGGETTVTIPPGVIGRGGRCSEFLLALLQETLDIPGISALAADTDGIDGSENNAGAFFHEGIRQQCIEEQIDIEHYLKTHDAYGFFAHVQALLYTGPTLTNVNDYRIVLLDPNE
jgi:hydroxypyruvate reductase